MMLREFADLEKGIGKFCWEAGGWREASTILHATLGNLITHSGTIRRGTAVRSGVSNKKPKPLHLTSWWNDNEDIMTTVKVSRQNFPLCVQQKLLLNMCNNTEWKVSILGKNSSSFRHYVHNIHFPQSLHDKNTGHSEGTSKAESSCTWPSNPNH